jgi:RNA-splicing ligase RtcB
METDMEANHLMNHGKDKVLQRAAHTAQLVRGAIQRELEAELRGLLMAARMQGFRLVLEDAKPRAVDLHSPL